MNFVAFERLICNMHSICLRQLCQDLYLIRCGHHMRSTISLCSLSSLQSVCPCTVVLQTFESTFQKTRLSWRLGWKLCQQQQGSAPCESYVSFLHFCYLICVGTVTFAHEAVFLSGIRSHLFYCFRLFWFVIQLWCVDDERNYWQFLANNSSVTQKWQAVLSEVCL